EAARAEAMAQRPTQRRRSGIERRVEELFRGVWSAHRSGDDDLPTLLPANDAESNAEWARRTAKALETKYGANAARGYRRMPEMTLWDTTITTRLPDDAAHAPDQQLSRKKSARDPWHDPKNKRGGSATPGSGQSSPSQGKQGGTAAESKGQNPTSRVDADGTAGRGDESEPQSENSPSPSPGATGGTTDGNADAKTSDDAAGKGSEAGTTRPDSTDGATLNEETTFRYPEWDVFAQALNATGT